MAPGVRIPHHPPVTSEPTKALVGSLLIMIRQFDRELPRTNQGRLEQMRWLFSKPLPVNR